MDISKKSTIKIIMDQDEASNLYDFLDFYVNEWLQSNSDIESHMLASPVNINKCPVVQFKETLLKVIKNA